MQPNEEGGGGIIHAYTDELSQQYAGANGAHRMQEALRIVGFKWVTDDGSGGIKSTTALAASDVRPVVQLGSISPGDVVIDGDQATISVQGEIRDPIMDNAPASEPRLYQAAITTADANINVALVTKTLPSQTFRQHATVGVLSPTNVSVKAVGQQNIRISAGPNLDGFIGGSSIQVVFEEKEVADAPAGNSISLHLWLPNDFNANTQDSVLFSYISNKSTAKALLETNSDTLVFASSDQLPTRAVIDPGSVANGVRPEALIVAISLPGGFVGKALFRKLSDEDIHYQASITTINGDGVPRVASVSNVVVNSDLTDVPAGTYPVALEVAGLEDVAESISINVGGIDCDTQVKEDGIRWLKGPSRFVGMIVKKKINGSEVPVFVGWVAPKGGGELRRVALQLNSDDRSGVVAALKGVDFIDSAKIEANLTIMPIPNRAVVDLRTDARGELNIFRSYAYDYNPIPYGRSVYEQFRATTSVWWDASALIQTDEISDKAIDPVAFAKRVWQASSNGVLILSHGNPSGIGARPVPGQSAPPQITAEHFITAWKELNPDPTKPPKTAKDLIFYSCSVGGGADPSQSMAQKIADATGVTVWAAKRDNAVQFERVILAESGGLQTSGAYNSDRIKIGNAFVALVKKLQDGTYDSPEAFTTEWGSLESAMKKEYDGGTFSTKFIRAYVDLYFEDTMLEPYTKKR